VGVGDAARRARSFPHELSGGLRQRVAIAMALACEPTVLIADEPTSALDVTVQAQILELLRRLQRERGLTVLLVTHDLGVVAGFADEVAVMYAGRLVERGDTRSVFSAPAMPYTQALMAAVPRLDAPSHSRVIGIGGAPPDAHARPPGCAFAPRCARADDRCRTERPELLGTLGHVAACHHPGAEP
jgi:oligopeptide/dipeptide ABC transporter ATP-binding protein